MRVGYICGYLDILGVQYSFVPPGITPDAYIFVGVDLLRCPIGLKPRFNQNFHRMFSCDLFIAGESTCETGWTTGDHQTTVIATKLRQTVDDIHIQQ